jgi:hypothetical protein
LNPGSRGGKPATNRLSYGGALFIVAEDGDDKSPGNIFFFSTAYMEFYPRRYRLPLYNVYMWEANLMPPEYRLAKKFDRFSERKN